MGRIDRAVDSWHPVGERPSNAEMNELKLRVAGVIIEQAKEIEAERDRLKAGLDQIWTENFEWAQQNLGFREFAERIGGQILSLKQGLPVKSRKETG